MSKRPEINYDPVTAHVPGVNETIHQEELKAHQTAGDPSPSPQFENKPKKMETKFTRFLKQLGIKIS